MENLEIEKKITVKQITDPKTIENIATKDFQSLLQTILETSGLTQPELRLPLKNYKGHEKAVLLGLFNLDTRQLFTSGSTVNCRYVIKSLDKGAKLYYITPNELHTIFNYVDLESMKDYYSLSYSDLPKTKVTFGMYSSKMKHAGLVFDDYDLSMRQLYTLDKTNSYMVEILIKGLKSKFDEEKVKFVVKDLIFIPKFSSKGYNLPKDRQIKIGETVVRYKYQGYFFKGTIIDAKPGFQQFTDKKGKPVKNMYYYVNHEGKLLRFQLSNLKVY